MKDMAEIPGRSEAFIAAIASSCADVDSLSALIDEDHDWRRRHPERFFAEFAADLWADVTDGAAQTDFQARAHAAPWWATDVVECLEQILTDHPSWAPSLLVEASGRGHWLGDPSNDKGRYFEWFAEQVAVMRASADAGQPGDL
jgi:hypothetical protein